MANFHTPYYLDNFEKVFRFSEYEDNENYFLRLVYLIRRTEYAKYATPHGTYPSLDVNITAHNGKKIFRDAYDVLDGVRSFRLLSESARDRAPNDLPHVIQVEQIYGYAPSVTHTRGEQVDWVQPGYVDRTAVGSFDLWREPGASDTIPPWIVEYNQLQEQFIVRLSTSVHDIVAGDIVRLFAYRPQIGGRFASDLTSQQTTVELVSGAYITIAAVDSEVRTYATGSVAVAQWTPTIAANFADKNPTEYGFTEHNISYNRYRVGDTTWSKWDSSSPAGSITELQRIARRTPSKNLSPGALVERTYFYRSAGMPVQQPAFSPQTAAGEAVDVLDTSTQPTAAQYLTMVANGDLLRPTGERIGHILGDVWYKDTFWLRAQLQ